MRVRDLKQDDLEAIADIHAKAGYAFILPNFTSPLIETAQVVENDEGEVVMGACAVRVPELYLFCAPGGTLHPLVKLENIKLLHEAIRDELVPKGYIEGFAFLPPEIEKPYGRHLKRLGWQETWKAFRVLDWRGGK